MKVWFLLLAVALALSDAGPTPDPTHHDDHNDHTDHNDHYDHGHGGSHNDTYDIGDTMMHGGFCKMIMDKFHELMMYMGIDEYMSMEKEYGLDCDVHGNFKPKQCHTVSEDEEWCACVDIHSGQIVPNTMTKGKLMCDEHGKIPITRCPDGWTYYTDHYHEYCFKFFDDPKTWVEAEGYCQFEGGHLASVHCPETEHFLQLLSRGDTYVFPITWLGASNGVEPCFWFWLDGTTMKYENFYKEETKYRNDSCLQLNHACSNQFKWGSGSCHEHHPFICALEIMSDDYHYYHH